MVDVQDFALEHSADHSNIEYLKMRLGGKNLPTVHTLDDLIRELRIVFDTKEVNVELVDYLMKSYKSNPADWKKYAKFDRYKYTRNLVDGGNGRYNLIILCWGEGHGSAIHDHANSHCFMKLLEGQLQEIRFAWPKTDNDDRTFKATDEDVAAEQNQLQETLRTTIDVDNVCYMNDCLGLHRVENSSSVDKAISLHLYCPPFQSCKVFNQNTGQSTTAKVTFWSIYGEKKSRNLMDNHIPEDN